MRALVLAVLLAGCRATPTDVWAGGEHPCPGIVRLPQGTVFRTPDGRRYRAASRVTVVDTDQYEFMVYALAREVGERRARTHKGYDF